MARGCSVIVAVGKDEGTTLPRVSATDANVVRSAVGDLPPCRHVQRLFAIFNISAIINSAHMQRHVEAAAVALGNAGVRSRVWGPALALRLSARAVHFAGEGGGGTSMQLMSQPEEATAS